MSTVISGEICPQCKGSAYNEFNTHTWEEYSICEYCGRRFETHLQLNEDGLLFKSEAYPCGKMLRSFSKGYGVMCLTYDDGNGQFIPFVSNKWKEVKNALKIIERNREILSLGDCYITKWDKKHKKLKTVFGKLPENEPNSAPITLDMCVSEDTDFDDGLPF